MTKQSIQVLDAFAGICIEKADICTLAGNVYKKAPNIYMIGANSHQFEVVSSVLEQAIALVR